MKVRELLNETVSTVSDASFETKLDRLLEKIHDQETSTADMTYNRDVIKMIIEFFATVFKLPESAVHRLRSDDFIDFFRSPHHIEGTLTDIHQFIKKYGPNCFSPIITVGVESSTKVKVFQNDFDPSFFVKCAAGIMETQETNNSPWQWLEMLHREDGYQFDVKNWERSEKLIINRVNEIVKQNPGCACFEWILSEDVEDQGYRSYTYCYSVIKR